MKFYSTNDRNHRVSFQEAVFRSLPPDNGLYFPERIPAFTKEWFENSWELSLPEIGFEVARAFIEDEIEESVLHEIVHDALGFEIPLVEVEDNIFSMELFHGPTWAFKDVGARFLARCMGYFTKRTGKEITILVATSGDTGGAVAAGFYGVPGVNVVILFPKGKVSEVQQLQLTTWGDNIAAFEIDGAFDDCQALVKKAFLDPELNSKLNLSSANSINIARLMPQTFYYFLIYSLMQEELVISVPSGNYGNLTAGLLAHKMGMPVKKFIAASNTNKIVPDYLETGEFQPKKSTRTYSNAMDVGDPSNFVRMMEIYHGSHKEVTSEIEGFWLNDEQTLEAMKKCFRSNEYILDPHGAIGYQALKEKLNQGEKGVFLETAHPVKFQPVLDLAFGGKIQYPEMVRELEKKPTLKTEIDNDFEVFKSILLK